MTSHELATVWKNVTKEEILNGIWSKKIQERLCTCKSVVEDVLHSFQSTSKNVQHGRHLYLQPNTDILGVFFIKFDSRENNKY